MFHTRVIDELGSDDGNVVIVFLGKDLHMVRMSLSPEPLKSIRLLVEGNIYRTPP